MVWARTFKKMAERTDIHPALKKLWKKHVKVDGQVTQHLSPFEQHINKNWLKEIPAKFIKRAKEILLETGPGLSVGIFAFYYGDAEYKNLAYHHRA